MERSKCAPVGCPGFGLDRCIFNDCRIQALRQQVEDLEAELAEAERSYDLERAGRIKYGQLGPLKAQLEELEGARPAEVEGAPGEAKGALASTRREDQQVDLKLVCLLAGFSFDAYTEINRAAGVWINDGGENRAGIRGVQTALLSPSFVRDACRGILRVRLLAAENLKGVPVAGSVAVALRTGVDAPGTVCGATRSTTRRGVLNGLARWFDEDESMYLYVARDGTGEGGQSSLAEPVLHVEVQKRDIIDMQAIGIVGTASVPFSAWSDGQLKDVVVTLQQRPESNVVDPAASLLRLQLQYDAFSEVNAPAAAEAEGGAAAAGVRLLARGGEVADSVTWELRSRQRRYGSAVPSWVLTPKVDQLEYGELTRALRRRGLPCAGESTQELAQRLTTSLEVIIIIMIIIIILMIIVIIMMIMIILISTYIYIYIYI